jgi:hypothetical protein
VLIEVEKGSYNVNPWWFEMYSTDGDKEDGLSGDGIGCDGVGDLDAADIKAPDKLRGGIAIALPGKLAYVRLNDPIGEELARWKA